ncbi:hypothetical protein [Prevotella heparinolytica]|uniref:hypothetical protein n=1 Tax=Prevotella heparinolytica TaxID=28113 RepID=UPI00104A73AE|nr:hypothetical protein [Bacteroides heparinolyticus]
MLSCKGTARLLQQCCSGTASILAVALQKACSDFATPLQQSCDIFAALQPPAGKKNAIGLQQNSKPMATDLPCAGNATTTGNYHASPYS